MRCELALLVHAALFHCTSLFLEDGLCNEGMICEVIEFAISKALPGTHVTTHLEPLEDPVSWADQERDRPDK